MALTEDQIKNLKPGDPVIIHGTFSFMCYDGDLAVKVQRNDFLGTKFVLSSSVSLPPEKPKYDPYRKLKWGDVVELVEWNGRFPIPKSYFKEIGIKKFRVVAEECRGIVTIDILGTPHPLPICFINLITPVEEIEKWHVYHDKDGNAFEVKTENHNETAGVICYGDRIRTEKEAEIEAETMCAKLNERRHKN